MDVVQGLYRTYLHRSADLSGLNTFTLFLGNGGTAEQVAVALIGSAEYIRLHGSSNDGFLSAVYQDLLHRTVGFSGAQWSA